MERISVKRDEARKERDEALSATQKIAAKALSFGDEAFKNPLEQVAVLNPEITFRTCEANKALNALGGMLVEYNTEKSYQEV